MSLLFGGSGGCSYPEPVEDKYLVHKRPPPPQDCPNCLLPAMVVHVERRRPAMTPPTDSRVRRKRTRGERTHWFLTTVVASAAISSYSSRVPVLGDRTEADGNRGNGRILPERERLRKRSVTGGQHAEEAENVRNAALMPPPAVARGGRERGSPPFSQHDSLRPTSVTRTTTELRPFGTSNGYDREGGTEPLCWTSSVENWDYYDNTATEGDHEEEIARIFAKTAIGGQDALDAELKTSCFDGFDLQIVPLEEGILRVGEFYDFRISAKVRQYLTPRGTQPFDDFPAAPPADTASSSNADGRRGIFTDKISPLNRIYLRVVLCDTRNLGFCTPFVTTNQAEIVWDGKEEGEEGNDPNSVGTVSPQFVVSCNGVQSAATPFYGEAPLRTNFDIDPNTGTAYVDLSLESVFSVKIHTGGKGGGEQEKENGHSRGGHRGRNGDMSFFVLGHAAFFSEETAVQEGSVDGGSPLMQRVDVANLAPEHLVTYQSPEILTNTEQFEIVLAVILVIAACAEIVLFTLIVYHRRNNIMQLSQAPLLGLLVLSGAVATVSCYFFMPLSTRFCRLVQPMVLIPLTVIGTTLLARIWRINAVLTPAMQIGTDGPDGQRKESPAKEALMRTLGWITEWERLCYYCGGFYLLRRETSVRLNSRRSSKFRQKVTMARLWRLTFSLVLPQCTLQACTLVFSPPELVTEFNDSVTVGRSTCSQSQQWMVWVGYVLVILPFALTFFLAFHSRNLPSLFNETRSIFQMGKVTSIVLLVGVPLLAITDSSLISPDVTAFLFTAIVLALVLTPDWFIVVPKLRMVLRGEKVVVSELLLRPYQGDEKDKGWAEASERKSSEEQGSIRSSGISPTADPIHKNSRGSSYTSRSSRLSNSQVEGDSQGSKEDPMDATSNGASKRATISSISFQEDTVFENESTAEKTSVVGQELAPSPTSSPEVANAKKIALRSLSVIADDKKSNPAFGAVRRESVVKDDMEVTYNLSSSITKKVEFVGQSASFETDNGEADSSNKREGPEFSSVLDTDDDKVGDMPCPKTLHSRRATMLPENLLRRRPNGADDVGNNRRAQLAENRSKSERKVIQNRRADFASNRSKSSSRKGRRQRELVVHVSRPLPARLDKNILYMSRLLHRISERSLAGRTVAPTELEELKDKGKKFGDMCGTLVITADTDDVSTKSSTVAQDDTPSKSGQSESLASALYKMKRRLSLD